MSRRTIKRFLYAINMALPIDWFWQIMTRAGHIRSFLVGAV